MSLNTWRKSLLKGCHSPRLPHNHPSSPLNKGPRSCTLMRTQVALKLRHGNPTRFMWSKKKPPTTILCVFISWFWQMHRCREKEIDVRERMKGEEDVLFVSLMGSILADRGNANWLFFFFFFKWSKQDCLGRLETHLAPKHIISAFTNSHVAISFFFFPF